MKMTRISTAFFYAFILLASGASIAQAENVGEYGKADVEVDRSVLQDLDNYQPPPMFAAPPSQRVAIPPPTQPQLTAPDTEKLLSHPVENNHVFTMQKSGQKSDGKNAASPASTLTPMPDSSERQDIGIANADALPPIPPKKPKAVAAAPVTDKEPTPNVAVKEEAKPIVSPSVSEPIKEVQKPKETVKQAYKPSAPKSMPAVPPIKVEAKPIPTMGNLPPPIEPENMERPSVGERMMDDALTRHMVKDEEAVREVMGIPPSKDQTEPQVDMDQFSMAFDPGKGELAQDQKNLLDQNVIPKLSSKSSIRLQIRAYASRTDGTESSSRRVSLSRALAARSYLLEKGIQPTRIDVRALSDNTTEPPTDRIDMSFIEAK